MWLVLLLACSSTTVLEPSDFDGQCEELAECKLVWGGDVCACDCEPGAVNEQAVSEYQAAYDEAVKHCKEPAFHCGPCAPVVVNCVEHQCVAEQAAVSTSTNK